MLVLGSMVCIEAVIILILSLKVKHEKEWKEHWEMCFCRLQDRYISSINVWRPVDDDARD